MTTRRKKFHVNWIDMHAAAWLWGLTTLLVQFAHAQPIPDRDTLLLLQFDESLDAGYAAGTATVDAGALVPNSDMGRFGGGLELGVGDRVTIVGDDGNFHPAAGTIEFWCRLNWAGNSPEKHSFLACAMGDRQYININYQGRGRLGIAVAGGDSDGWTWRRSNGDISQWKPDTWHHVAFAWGSGRLCVYVDGQACSDIVTDAEMPSGLPETIHVLGFDGMIDGLRISKCSYTVQDTQRSMGDALDPPYRHVSDLPGVELQRAWADQRLLLGNVPIPMLVGSRRYNKGFVSLPGGTVVVPLNKRFETFRATIGACPYTGQIQLRTADGDGMNLPLCVEVLPFRLRPAEHKGYGVYYHFPAMTDDWSHVDVELADIRAHGANMLKWNVGVEFERDGDRVRPAYERFRRGLELLRKHQFHGPLPVGSGCEQAARLLNFDPVADHGDARRREQFLQLVQAGLEGLLQLSAEYPEFEFLPTHMDEIFGHDRMERYIRLTEAVRQVPELRVYITLHNDPQRDVTDLMQRCDPYVDVRCYNGHCMDNWLRAGHTFGQLAQELEEAGDEAWLYHNIRGSFFAAEWMRLVNGYYLWISPLQVHVPWMYYSFKGNPMDCTDGPHLRGGDFAFAVPDPNDALRMIPTRHWEAFREGIDDMRYLATLEQLAREHSGTPQSDSVLAWLAELRDEITPKPSDLEPIDLESPLLVHWSRNMNGADYRRIRHQAAQQIVQLSDFELEPPPSLPGTVGD